MSEQWKESPFDYEKICEQYFKFWIWTPKFCTMRFSSTLEWDSEEGKCSDPSLLVSFGFGMIPQRESSSKPSTGAMLQKAGWERKRGDAAKSRMGSKERSRGAADSEVEPASNKSRTFQHQPNIAASALQLLVLLHQSLLGARAELSFVLV